MIAGTGGRICGRCIAAAARALAGDGVPAACVVVRAGPGMGLRCSFCGLDVAVGDGLVQRDGVRICSECVSLGCAVLAESLAAPAAGEQP